MGGFLLGSARLFKRNYMGSANPNSNFMTAENGVTPIQEEVTTPPLVEPVTEPVEDAAPQVDYAAEYEKEKSRREKAEFTLYQKDKATRQARDQQVAEKGYIDEDEINRLVEEKAVSLFQAQREKDSEDIIEEEMMKLSTNDDERRLIRFKYDNGIQKTGFSRLAIREDLENAQFLANKTKYLREKGEMAQTIIAKKTMGNSGAGTNVDRPAFKDDLSKHFSKQDWDFMQRRHFTEEQIRSSIKK